MEVTSTLLFSIGVLLSIFWVPLLVVLLLLSFLRSSSELRKARQRLEIAEFKPPAGLTPSEIGLLYDDKISAKKEVLAAILSYLMLNCTSLGEKRLYDSLVNPGAPLTTKKLYTKIYGEYRLGNNAIEAFTKNVRNQLINKKMLASKKRYPIRIIKALYIYVPLIVIVLDTLLCVFGLVKIESGMESALLEFIAMQTYGYVLYALGMTLCLIAYASFTKNFKNITFSPKLRRDTWDEIRGYRYYLAATVEKEKLEYLLNNTGEQLKQYDYLPYAVALGVIKPEGIHNLIERVK
jgi:hypothetical protein